MGTLVTHDAKSAEKIWFSDGDCPATSQPYPQSGGTGPGGVDPLYTISTTANFACTSVVLLSEAIGVRSRG